MIEQEKANCLVDGRGGNLCHYDMIVCTTGRSSYYHKDDFTLGQLECLTGNLFANCSICIHIPDSFYVGLSRC